MRLAESITVAFRALGVNRLRSLLTMLGIVIGVAAVIALVSAGQGAQKMVSNEIDALGSNLIMVTPRGATRLELEDTEFLLDRVPVLASVMPITQSQGQVTWRSNSANVSIQGVTEIFPEIRSFSLDYGRFLIESDVISRRKVAVVGQTIVKDLFDGQDPVGKTMTVMGQSFTVVGVMEEKGEVFGMDQDSVVLIPITSLQRLAGTRYVSTFYAQVENLDDTYDAVTRIGAAFDNKFRRGDSVNVASQKQLLDAVSTVAGAFTTLLAAIAGISLLVGGIGIMNIMLVSVTERTREIGLRKAVGAKKRDIMFQFLVESSALSGFGGAIGIGLGSTATRLLAGFGGWDPYTSPSAILMALAFSIGVGMFFGLYPAARASKLDPIYCLRYE